MCEDSTEISLPDHQPEHYEILVQGILDPCWSEWLGCSSVINTPTGDTLLVCLFPDQTALHGLLAKIRDMNLKLIFVSRGESKTNHNEVE